MVKAAQRGNIYSDYGLKQQLQGRKKYFESCTFIQHLYITPNCMREPTVVLQLKIPSILETIGQFLLFERLRRKFITQQEEDRPGIKINKIEQLKLPTMGHMLCMVPSITQ